MQGKHGSVNGKKGNKQQQGEEDYDNDDDESDNDEEDNYGQHKGKRKMYNAALHARCTQLSIPYTSYLNALNALAMRDLQVFYKLCALLSITPTDHVAGTQHNIYNTTNTCQQQCSSVSSLI